MRKKLIAGNWKMFKKIGEAQSLIKEIAQGAGDLGGVELLVCPPYTALNAASEARKGTQIKVGAQDLHWEEQGAFTGKISWDMIRDTGAEYVIIGHSEQRTYFHETDDTVNKKTKTALKGGLIPVICVGETLAERDGNRTMDVVSTQTKKAFEGITKEDATKCVIAYEPVWAIGTGRNATPEQAQEVHAGIRALIQSLYDASVAEGMRILYGGSMKPDNAKSLLTQKDIDGGLIGGASLKADSFLAIARAGL
ncbi:MAG TPA: triose-phosphate isomerase [Leptospiraceae bacterium]|jgi:triosephosphate isomerase|nr:triose-phosphate isomerase [Leptospirales bacterium]HMX55666.1 triose-phosphate isomerase [Leptospiraceae bacterium]HMZ35078.1 triose-phosphate isomerase [Leptospiraceae bacterium]HNE21648.1 triose-phosphate isomerase [Leptospiraceae bacterium]HNJ02816.1 triose-phosphate isomerase [Leptospiraceae bacterium]